MKKENCPQNISLKDMPKMVAEIFRTLNYRISTTRKIQETITSTQATEQSILHSIFLRIYLSTLERVTTIQSTIPSKSKWLEIKKDGSLQRRATEWLAPAEMRRTWRTGLVTSLILSSAIFLPMFQFGFLNFGVRTKPSLCTMF